MKTLRAIIVATLVFATMFLVMNRIATAAIGICPTNPPPGTFVCLETPDTPPTSGAPYEPTTTTTVPAPTTTTTRPAPTPTTTPATTPTTAPVVAAPPLTAKFTG